MSALAPALEAFFTERLISQRHASPHTVAAYRDAWRLLLRFIHARTGKEPAQLDLADLGAPVISAFLEHLEQERRNSARTRNARLAAVHSFFHYAALRHPEHAALIAQVLAIPPKRCPRTEVSYLTRPELDALVAAPDQGTWTGRRDHALLEVAAQTGLRVSELTGLRNCDVELGTGAHVRCRGKGRKDRCTPLSRQTAAVLRAWLQERGGDPADPLFPSRRGTALSRGAVTTLVARHTATASQHCPSLRARHPTPHILRHSCAMDLLRNGVDTAVIALWLGHERVETTSRAYLHADMTIKERALARTAPFPAKPGRYRPPDRLLAFLDNL
jgi:integrase/recombinase XerD